jgi:hypothetical protein
MSAAFEADMPDTKYIAPTSTSGHANKEDDQIDIAERPQPRLRPPG